MRYRGMILLVILISVTLSGCCAGTFVKQPITPTPITRPSTAVSPSVTTLIAIKGTVHEYNGAPAINAKVTLWKDGAIYDSIINPQYSDNYGGFAFNNIPSGEYTVIAEKDGKSGSAAYKGSDTKDIFILDTQHSGATSLPQTVTPYPTTSPSTSTEYYQMNYKWTYDGTDWTDSLSIPKSMYEYYKNQPHNGRSDYTGYALSDYDRTAMKTLVDDFRKSGASKGYTEYDDIMNVVCFVQALPYTSDKVTTGYDEYPRYPIETLVDDGGDCEDTAILTAAFLNEMGYGVVLLRFPGHMAVGVKCSDDFSGTYYEYNDARYYYLETTGDNWQIGQIPDEFKNSQATIFPMVPIPQMDISFTSNITSYDNNNVYYRIHCNIQNLGPGKAKNVSVYMAALALSHGNDKVWAPTSTVSLGDCDEGATGWAEATLKIPRNENTQIECMVFGDNFNPDTAKSNSFNT